MMCKIDTDAVLSVSERFELIRSLEKSGILVAKTKTVDNFEQIDNAFET